MEGNVSGKTPRDNALEIARLLADGKAEDVRVLDVSGLCSWTDCFVIATVTSGAHCQGLAKQVKDYVRDNGMEIHLTHQKGASGDEWNLIDIGPVVVHLMSAAARGFYELEKLWHEGESLM